MVVIHKKKIETAEEKEARKLHEQELAMGIQDEYQAKGFELVSWAQEHRGVVLGLIVAFFVAGLSAAGYFYYQRRISEQASAAYLEIVRKLESSTQATETKPEERKLAQQQLVEMASKFKGAGPAVLANLYAGHLALDNNDPSGSVELYKSALQKIGPKDELYPVVLIGLGYAEERNGQHSEALQRFVQVSEIKDGPGRDLALWEAARLAYDAKEMEKAKGYIAQLLEEFPASIYEKNAKRLKESL